MDERATPTAPWTRLDWKLIGILALAALTLRGWQLAHTEVAARDSIGFIRQAWKFRQADLDQVPQLLANSEQHPLYPLAILGASQAIEPWFHGSRAELMRLSAQLVSVIAAVFLVLPVYALGRTLFDRRVGFLSALLLQTLPVSGRILADGLSESLFLLFAASSLWCGLVALRDRGRYLSFAGAGLFSGLAYLTRPEGALIALATGIVLVAGQAVRAWRRPWRETLLAGATLTAASLLLAGPFIATTGKLTVKPSGQRVLEHQLAEQDTRTSGVLFAVWNDPYVKTPEERWWWGFAALGTQLIKASFYLGWLGTLVGLYSCRTYWRQPGFWMLVLVSLMVAHALWRIAVVIGYLSDRHCLLILLCFLPWSIVGLARLGSWAATFHPRLNLVKCLPIVFVLAGMPKVLEPLHDHRTGLRAAGQWLAANTNPADIVTDPLCWSHYYAGRLFTEAEDLPGPRREYVVIEDAGNDHSRLLAFQEAKEKSRKGKPVYEKVFRRGKRTAKVIIYELPRS